ncbi:MAG: Wzz/FepE/Etk N-terminal domain-containing protein [Anaerolineae bacterium]
MELRDYGQMLRRRGWIILAVAVIAAISAFVFSRFLVTPAYRSEVLLSVLSTRTADYGSNLGAKGVVNNFAETIRQDDALAAQVADRLKLDLPPDTIKGRIQVDPDELNVTIRIRAEDGDPIIAKNIAQTYAQAFVEQRDIANQQMDQRDRVEVRILRNARDGDRFKPQTRTNTLAGLAVGALLGLLVVFALEYASAGTIRTASDIERYIGAPVLGMIPPAEGASPRRQAAGQGRESGARATPAK